MEDLFTWGALSGTLIAISSTYYAWAIYTRKIKRPVISAWGIWLIVSLLFFLTYYDAGARRETTLLAPLASLVGLSVIFIFSLRFGEKSWSWLDTKCVAMCLITVVAWQYFDSPLLGLVGACIADSMGIIPQMKKVWKEPGDEPWFPWVVFCIGSAVNFLAIQNWEIEQYLYPSFMVISSAFMTIPVVTHHIKKYKHKKSLLH